MVSKVFEKLVNNRLVDYIEKCGLFSDFQYGFRSSRSTPDLPTVVSDRIATAFNRSGPTFFLLYINNLPGDVICNIAIYADDTTLNCKCDLASDLWQELELVSELESDL